MCSSYSNEVDYGTLIEGLTIAINPSSIVEIGILEGFSLDCLRRGSSPETTIRAFDIFDEFNGNHANKVRVRGKFSDYPNVSIEYGNFYATHEYLNDVDIIHIDIANNGDVFEYAIQNYLPKLSPKGVLILEGGSEVRDNVDWMIKYTKPRIAPVVAKYGLKVLGVHPSLTIIPAGSLGGFNPR